MLFSQTLKHGYSSKNVNATFGFFLETSQNLKHSFKKNPGTTIQNMGGYKTFELIENKPTEASILLVGVYFI